MRTRKKSVFGHVSSSVSVCYKNEKVVEDFEKYATCLGYLQSRLLPVTVSCIMLKKCQTYIKNLAVLICILSRLIFFGRRKNQGIIYEHIGF